MLYIFLSFLGLSSVLGYSAGYDSCINVPNHGTWATGCNSTLCANSPYTIQIMNNGVSVTSYVPTTKYTIQITSPMNFRGFILNSGLGSDIATFTTVAALQQGSGTLTQGTDTHVRKMTGCTNGLTQTSATNVKTISAFWTAPPAGAGFVTFKAVIVVTQNGNNFVSHRILSEGVSSTTPSVTHTPTQTDVTNSISHTPSPTDVTNSVSVTPTPTSSDVTNSVSVTPTPTSSDVTNSVSVTPTPTSSDVTNSVSPTPTLSDVTNSVSPTPTLSDVTNSVSYTPTLIPSISPSISPSTTSITIYASVSSSPSLFVMITQSITSSPSPSPSPSPSYDGTQFLRTSNTSGGTTTAVTTGVIFAVASVGFIMMSTAFYFNKNKKRAVSTRSIEVTDYVTNNPIESTQATVSRFSLTNKTKKEFHPLQTIA